MLLCLATLFGQLWDGWLHTELALQHVLLQSYPIATSVVFDIVLLYMLGGLLLRVHFSFQYCSRLLSTWIEVHDLMIECREMLVTRFVSIS